MKIFKVNNKIFFLVLLVIILFFTFLSFKTYFLNKNFLIFTETSCDPLLESCFVGYCDPEYEKCSGIKEEDVYYYKKVQRLASFIPLCDPKNEECDATICNINELKCKQILCNPEDKTLDCSSSNKN
jgi:hypothetical protein